MKKRQIISHTILAIALALCAVAVSFMLLRPDALPAFTLSVIALAASISYAFLASPVKKKLFALIPAIISIAMITSFVLMNGMPFSSPAIGNDEPDAVSDESFLPTYSDMEPVKDGTSPASAKTVNVNGCDVELGKTTIDELVISTNWVMDSEDVYNAEYSVEPMQMIADILLHNDDYPNSEISLTVANSTDENVDIHKLPITAIDISTSSMNVKVPFACIGNIGLGSSIIDVESAFGTDSKEAEGDDVLVYESEDGSSSVIFHFLEGKVNSISMDSIAN